jgi:hypothetical protein
MKHICGRMAKNEEWRRWEAMLFSYRVIENEAFLIFPEKLEY